MAESICVVEGCGEPVWIEKRGLCKRCYSRWYHHGDARGNQNAPTCADCDKPLRNARLPQGRAMCTDCRAKPRAKARQRDIGYAWAHMRVTKIRGSARGHRCENCGRQAAHWAYDHKDPNEITITPGRAYSPDPAHYIPMCRSCHQRFDFDRRMEKYGPSDLLKRPVTDWSLDELDAGWAELGMYIRWRRSAEAAGDVSFSGV